MKLKIKEEKLLEFDDQIRSDQTVNKTEDFKDFSEFFNLDQNKNEKIQLKNDESLKFDIKPSFVKLSTKDTQHCTECQQILGVAAKFKPSVGCGELKAIKETRMSNFNWENVLASNHTIDYKMTDVCVYDLNGHFVSPTKGLIEEGVPIYMSGTLHNMSNHEEQMKVQKFGPLTGWNKPMGWKSPMIILSIEFEGQNIDFHILSTDFTSEYQEALQRSIFVEKTEPCLWMKEQSKRKSRCSSSDTNSDASDEDYLLPYRKKRKMAKVEKFAKKSGKGQSLSVKLLKSFNKETGFGNNLINLLPANDRERTDDIASFLCFVFERQSIWAKRRKGEKTWTSNTILATKFFTNMYRELDKGSIYVRGNVMNQEQLKGKTIDKTKIDVDFVSRALFKSVVYRLINKRKTFIDYGGIPELDSLSKFRKFLKKRMKAGIGIFTEAHQNNGIDRLMKTFDYLEKNISKLASELVTAAEKKSNAKTPSEICFDTIKKIPFVGNFFANQILCDLQETKTLGSNVTEDQWIQLGPGAKHGLRRLFDLETSEELEYTRLLKDICTFKGPKSGFERLGMSFPAFIEKPLSLKNIEHALCEYDKYFRYVTNDSVRDRTYQSSNVGKSQDKSKCLLCDFSLKQTLQNYSEADDQAYLCHTCLKIEFA